MIRQKQGNLSENFAKGRSSAKIAERVGVSDRTLEKIPIIREASLQNPTIYGELWDRVGEGKMKIDKGYNTIKKNRKIRAAEKLAANDNNSQNFSEFVITSRTNSTIKQIYSPADTTSARTTEIMRSPNGVGRIFAAVSKDLERSYFMGAFRRSQYITYWHKLLRQYKKPFILLTKREEPNYIFTVAITEALDS